ncbi:MAG: HPr(Ser) kinase/phosphatase [Polyangiaceae bacterium]|nr:HPr(Ser) kinase/phosphatase [Polyangiaceae bacterium]
MRPGREPEARGVTTIGREAHEQQGPPVSVRELLGDPALDLSLSLLAGGGGLDRRITHPRVQKSGLALVGHRHGVVPTRVQVLGETELSYVESLEPARRVEAARALFSFGLSCVLVTRGASPAVELVAEAEATQTPLLSSPHRSSAAINALHALLDERLAPRTRIHGVLVDVFEVGVLLLGRSGIGKSECALELVMRGHRLVADDAIEVDYRPPGMVFGQAPPVLRHLIEVRGLGILDIKDLYGVTAIRDRKRIDIVVELELEKPDSEIDRLGLDDRRKPVLGVPVRAVTLPVRSGRNMSSIIEIAARNELLRQAGRNAGRDLVQAVDRVAQGAPAGLAPRVASPNESALPPPASARPRR